MICPANLLSHHNMKIISHHPFLITVLTIASLATSRADQYYGYDERDYHGGEHHMSSTEKVIAGAAVAALAVAAAKDSQRRQNAEPQYYRGEAPPPPDYRGQDHVVVVRIRNADGACIPVYLHRTPSGYVGPRGEYYPSMPSAEALGRMYGGWDERPQSRPSGQPRPSAPKASVEQGRVRILRDGRTVATVRPAMPNVERYKFTNSNQQIIIKSRGNHGPATVELFNISDGSLADKVLAFAIKGGKPSWARGWED